MSFTKYKMVIEQMVDVGLLGAMPSRAQLRRDYNSEIQRFKRSARKTIKNKTFQKIEWTKRMDNWIHKKELQVLARRGPLVRRTASRPTVTDIPPLAQPTHTPRTLDTPTQRREARPDPPREHRVERSDLPRRQREATADRPVQSGDVTSDRPGEWIEALPYRPSGQRGEAPGKSTQTDHSDDPTKFEEDSDASGLTSCQE